LSHQGRAFQRVVSHHFRKFVWSKVLEMSTLKTPVVKRQFSFSAVYSLLVHFHCSMFARIIRTKLVSFYRATYSFASTAVERTSKLPCERLAVAHCHSRQIYHRRLPSETGQIYSWASSIFCSRAGWERIVSLIATLTGPCSF